MLQLHVRSLASLALKQTTTRRIIFNTTIRNPSSSKNYTSVAIRGVPNSFSNALAKESPTDPISVPTAVQQHEVYKEYLSCIVPRVIDLEADESYPDCVFIEDTAIVIDDQAVITRIGADSRKGEVDAIKEALVGIGLKVTDMRSDDNDNDDNGIATCDGGDVLYPVSYTRDPKTGGPLQKRGGNHLFVGISSRTNHAGANFLQRAFPHIEVVPVELGDLSSEALHLKSIVVMHSFVCSPLVAIVVARASFCKMKHVQQQLLHASCKQTNALPQWISNARRETRLHARRMQTKTRQNKHDTMCSCLVCTACGV